MIFSLEKDMKIINWEQDFMYMTEESAVRKAEFVSDRMSYIVLRGRCCYVIFLNVHAPSEEKTDDLKDSFMRN